MSEQNTPIVSSNIPHIVVCAALIGVDQWSKGFAFFKDLPSFSYNQGISFGILSTVQYEVVLALTICAVIVLVLVWRKAVSHVLADYPYIAVLFFAGAISNVIDRLLYGGVRDWLPIPFIGIYNNLADWYIFIAVVCMILLEIRSQFRRR